MDSPISFPIGLGGSGSSSSGTTQLVGNTNATIDAGTSNVQLTAALTASRVYTLPAASGFAAGTTLTFTDIANTLTSANTATLQRDGSDTINGGTSIVLSTPGASPILVSDGSTKWNLDIRGIARGGTGATTAAAAAVNIVNGNPINPSTIGATTPGTVAMTNGSASGQMAAAAINGPGAGGFGTVQLCASTAGGAPNMTVTDSKGASIRSNNVFGITSDATNSTFSLVDVAFGRSSAGVAQINSGTAGTYRDLILRCLKADRTDTTAGTTGAVTINKCAGSVNFAAAATSLVVTNSHVATTSRVIAMVNTNDTTAIVKNVVSASGSFTITLNAAATAETNVSFFVLNP